MPNMYNIATSIPSEKNRLNFNNVKDKTSKKLSFLLNRNKNNNEKNYDELRKDELNAVNILIKSKKLKNRKKFNTCKKCNEDGHLSYQCMNFLDNDQDKYKFDKNNLKFKIEELTKKIKKKKEMLKNN